MESFDLLTSLTAILIKISVSYVLLGLFILITVEGVSTLLRLRTRYLRTVLEKSFNDNGLLQRFYQHPLITILGENTSYINPKIFSHALLDVLNIQSAPDLQNTQKAGSAYSSSDFVRALAVLSRSTISVEQVRKNAEFLFNDFVSKVSNGYKVKVQKIILIVATILTVAANIDSIKIFNAIRTNTLTENVKKTLQQDKSISDSQMLTLDEYMSDVFPVGWKGENLGSFSSLVSKLAGWMITIVFASFATQFLYSRYISAGKPATKKTKDE